MHTTNLKERMCTDIFAGEFDAALEEFDDLFFAEGSIAGRRRKTSKFDNRSSFATIGGRACGACLGAFKLVVVGAQHE